MKKLNFIEATNRGKGLARVYYPQGKIWDDNKFDFKKFTFVGCSEIYPFQLKSLVNAQFVLEEISITITESEFENACENTNLGDFNKLYLKKELGFK